MRAIVPAMILFLAVCTLSQTKSGLISGQILDTAGAVIPGARVTLEINGKTIAEAVSDSQGGYKFADIPVGEYSLTVKYLTPRIFRKIVVLTAGKTSQANVVLSFRPCSNDSDNGKSPAITEADRIEITRALIDLSFGKEASYFVPSNIDVRWLMPGQKGRMNIKSREQLQEITERDGPVEYYSIAPLEQRGGCVAGEMVTNWTVKGQFEDANMAGGGTIYEFRKVAGRRVGEVFFAYIV